MIIPVRCFTCGSLVGDKWEAFEAKVEAGIPAGQALDELGVKRMCCRRMLLSYVDIIHELVHYTRPI
jgi:DNA-directed RNA polymerase subunit N